MCFNEMCMLNSQPRVAIRKKGRKRNERQRDSFSVPSSMLYPIRFLTLRPFYSEGTDLYSQIIYEV